MSDTSPYPYFYPDTEVLVYTSQGSTDWQPLPFAMVPWGGEFQFDDYLCGIDQEGRVWVSPNISAAQLLEADRNFDPYNWRWPESEDVVRFVDRDNHHLRHDRMGRFQVGDRFWYQGILWEASADPNSPTEVVYQQTAFVQNKNGEAVLVDGYPAKGALNEGAYSQVGYTLPTDVTATSDSPPSDPPAMDAPVLVSYPAAQSPVNVSSNAAGPGNLGAFLGIGQATAPLAQSLNSAQLSSSSGMPTDFGFAGQRYDSSTGLIHMGARYYDPSLGRFISPDTIVPDLTDPQSFNRYSYVRNRPLNRIDPDGHIDREPPTLIQSLPYDTTAFELGRFWFTEQGPTHMAFYEDHNLTQSLMHDEGVNVARELFYQALEEGTLVNGTDSTYPYKYRVIPYVREGVQYLTGDDQVGFYLGSYTVNMHMNADKGIVTFVVRDPKTLESGTRSPFYYIPDGITKAGQLFDPSYELHRSRHSAEDLIMGSQFDSPQDIFLASVLSSRSRGDPGLFGSDIHFGGNVDMIFTWTEPLQVDQGE